MAALEVDLEVVSQLRQAAGPTTPIVLGTSDNPVPTSSAARTVSTSTAPGTRRWQTSSPRS